MPHAKDTGHARRGLRGPSGALACAQRAKTEDRDADAIIPVRGAAVVRMVMPARVICMMMKIRR